MPVLFLILVQSLYAAATTCNSCSDCTAKRAAAQEGDIFDLTQDIVGDSGSSCIDFGSSAAIDNIIQNVGLIL